MNYKDCSARCFLATYIGRKAASVLAGVKPAVLMAFRESDQLRCESGAAFRECGERVIGELGLDFVVLKAEPGVFQVLVFDRAHLERAINTVASRKLLARMGYPLRAGGLDGDIARLSRRFVEKEEFPHEIGIFLGYPVKDVAGYIYRRGDCVSCRRGMWRMFGRPDESLKLMAAIRKCERYFEEMLKCGFPPEVLSRSIRRGEMRCA